MDMGTLVMKISADSKQATSVLNNFSKTVGNVGKTVAKGAMIGAAAIGGGLVFALKDGLNGIMAMENATAQMDAVIKSTGSAAGVTTKELTNYAEALQKTTKFATEDTMAAQNMLLTFTNIGKDVFPQATTTLLDMATAMGTDAKSGAIQLGKALNNPTQGITALTRVGVTFTDEQKKMIEKMQEAGDIAGAQTVILDELKKEFGGSAEAAGKTFAGQMVIAKNAVGELFEGLATTLMPSLINLLKWVNSNMPKIQEFMTNAFKKITEVSRIVYEYFKANILPILKKLFDWIQANMPKIQEGISTAWGIMADVMQKVWKLINEKVIPIFEKIWIIIEPLLPLISAAFKLAFDLVYGVIDVVLGIINNFLSLITGSNDKVEPELKKLSGSFSAEFGAILTIIQAVQKAVDYFNNTDIKAKNAQITDPNKKKYMEKYSSTSIGDNSPIPYGGGRAFGGAVQAGKKYLVGERGREAFIPDVNGTISATGGNNITVNINGITDPKTIWNEFKRNLKLNGVRV
jgi:hypothetical protein